MGMASFTEDQQKISDEFHQIKELYDKEVIDVYNS